MTAQPLIAPAEAHLSRERAALKRRLGATRARAAIGAGLAVLASPTPRVAVLSIRELLVALYGVGRARAQMVLDVTRGDPATALGTLTVDDRRRPTRASAGLVGPRVRLHGGRRRTTVARQDGAPAARNEAGDGPAPGETPTTGAAMSRPSHQLPAFLVGDPTRAEQREALWRMSPAERITAMYRGDLTLNQCLAWAARYPEEVPTLNGEWWFIAIRTADIADHDDEARQQ
jgi:hypothetical protein